MYWFRNNPSTEAIKNLNRKKKKKPKVIEAE
jgi:hypothetical protein